jgi:16S rRNA processing protein RimM
MGSGTPDDGSAVLRIGRVGRPHGNEGAFTVSEPTTRLELLDAGCCVLVGGREMTVSWRRGTAARPLLRLEGADGRTAIEALRGAEIQVSREAVGALPEGEYLIDDLVGCEVVDGPRRIGTVREVLLLPAADVLEIARDDGGPLLMPMVADAVRSIDLAVGRIDVDVAFVSADAD